MSWLKTFVVTPFEERYSIVNSIVSYILIIYSLIQLICWFSKVDIPNWLDQSINLSSVLFIVFGYLAIRYQTRHIPQIGQEPDVITKYRRSIRRSSNNFNNVYEKY